MELVDSHQNHLKVMNVQPVKGIETTYNLTVLDNHTFYVGEDKIWVHNAGKNCDRSVKTKVPVSVFVNIVVTQFKIKRLKPHWH